MTCRIRHQLLSNKINFAQYRTEREHCTAHKPLALCEANKYNYISCKHNCLAIQFRQYSADNTYADSSILDKQTHNIVITLIYQPRPHAG